MAPPPPPVQYEASPVYDPAFFGESLYATPQLPPSPDVLAISGPAYPDAAWFAASGLADAASWQMPTAAADDPLLSFAGPSQPTYQLPGYFDPACTSSGFRFAVIDDHR